ncbi:MAG: poly-beta-1,6 N-acetyl-D-glucosamine export porin PgaA [Halomonas sp.]|jgi:biofilm PGA synthesis protein PgaA|uniref:poly-beta-1,6 N-acetyl-D-glucosamine export porin PgaA n=1 Tax=Halomonas sp. MCCC 1A11057 TaxID=2733482 RepID=UPI001F29238E|nr:poly-beta-1,6 N-acetyl-D-glucosamine export porin PgaA [Halomonas sp. MCCC 1A11057]MCE8035224.1 poly-beta-1,6 N-acetyl-D-glucosamine export porin PgaA [Halomonas sp. MCCC 1A11057]MDX5432644.1 poly-beta-1,6 N-acetyl-D-glucosamine export porin PgaA [Halomonas sp.]
MKRLLDAVPLCAIALLPLAALADASIDSQRQALVQQAVESGKWDTSIMSLRSLYERTGNVSVRSDLIALLIRAERFEEALSVCADCYPAEFTSHELLDLGGAARRQGELDLALEFFTTLTHREPEEPAAWLGQALVYVDQGRYVLAESTLKRHEILAGPTLEAMEARGYLAAETNDALAELQARQALVERQPERVNEIRALYRLAVGLGASEPARELLDRHPDLFNASDALWLHYYEGVNDIRLGIHVDDHRSIERGLGRLDQVLESEDVDHDLRLLAEHDKIVALAHLRRFTEAEAMSQRLLLQYGSLPNYVLRARAHALSGLGRPEQAIPIYHAILRDEPQRGDDLSDPLYEGLFFSYTDARRHREAQRLLAEWRRAEPLYRRDFTGTTQIENPNLQKVLLLDTMLMAWRGNEHEAHAQVDAYLAEAPANPYLWQLRGDISRWRGWPEQAQADYQRAASLLGPEQRDTARHGELIARLQQGRWRGTVGQVRHELDSAKPSVSRDNLEREWREQRAAELALSVERSDGQGGGSTQASREWLSDVVFRSPRNDNGSRYYVQHRHQYGTFDEGSLRAGYAIAGYEWNLFPSQLTLSAGHGMQLNDEPHFGATLRHDFTDHLAVTLGAEYNSLTTPLRALNDEVHADRYRAAVTYRHDERRTLGTELSLTDFDDGNLRRNILGYWQERLYQRDRWLLAATGWIGASRNDDVQASYYNPERDTHLSGELLLEYAHPLGYRQTFTQGVTLGAGRYWQRGEASEETWSLGYHQRWEFLPSVSLEYGIARERAVYDGQAEHDTVLTGALVWRFP